MMAIRILVASFVILGFFVLYSEDTSAEVYKWVDEDGNVHYTDQPPPQGHDAEELILESSPSGDDVREAQERLDRLKAKQQTGQDQRSAAKEQKRLQKELEQEQRVDRQRQCILALKDFRALTTKLPVYSLDQTGDRVYLDAEERAAEIERKRADINKFCN